MEHKLENLGRLIVFAIGVAAIITHVGRYSRLQSEVTYLERL